MRNGVLAAFVLLVSLAASTASAQSWDETTQGGGDAGDLPGTAQSCSGVGALNEITGNIPAGTDRDVFLIRISSPATFSATTTVTPGTNTDTQLRLFDAAGMPIAYNDDAGANFLSTLPAGNALYSGLAAGNYLLAVSSWNSRSMDIVPADQFPNTYTGVIAPNAGAGALASWTGTPSNTGTYRITLTGCQLVSAAGDPEIDVQRGGSIATGGTDNLGVIAAATATQFQWTVANQGATQNLTVSSITAAASGVGNCSVTASPTLVPASPVAAGGTATFSIDVTPTATGAFQFTITISSNDADEGTYTVIVQGSAGMSGTYTVNSAGGADFTDIGAAFDALEDAGVLSAVVIEVSGGPYTATASYELGYDAGVADPVVGLSASNTLTIRSATSSLIQVSGNFTGSFFAGAVSASGTFGISVPYATLEGFEITGGTDFGVIVAEESTATANNVTIRRCKIHNVSAGGGIWAGGFPNTIENFQAVNCMIWDCVTGLGAFNTQGLITVFRPGAGCSVESCTLIQSNGQENTGTFNSRCAIIGTINGALASMRNNILVHNVISSHALGFAAGFSPTAADYNLFYNPTASAFHQDAANFPNYLAWTTAGYDANGVNGDPLIASLTAPVNPALTSASPAVDAGNSTESIDIDGDARPTGSADDIGADEGQFPEMDVLRGANAIADGGTDTVNISGAGTNLTYAIENNGAAQLILNGATIVVLTPGTNVTSVTLTTPPTTPVAAGGNTTFVVNVVPTTSSLAGDPYSFTVSIDNDDSNENPYNFTVSGNALSNQPAQADLTTGSSLSGGTNGPFSISVNPGAALASVSIDLTDPEADTITVASITPPGTVPTGITPPSIPTPGQPLTLSWTGTADASNAPGAYLWVVTFADAVNGTNVVVNVTITINDVAPTHTAASGISGDGSAGTPYLTTYAENDPASLSVNLANVSDANTGQNLNLSTPIQTGGPTGGSGFTFSLVGGVLSVAPSATLVAADVGTQVFSMDVDDGPNTVTINVTITVLGNSGAISITNASPLPAGTVGAVYTTVTLTATGGTAPYTYTVISGALPAGLSLSLAGDITGTPTLAGTANFTVRATDSLNDSGTKAFTLTVNAPATGSGGGGGGGGGCSTDGEMPYSWLLLLGLLSLTALVVRTRKA